MKGRSPNGPASQTRANNRPCSFSCTNKVPEFDVIPFLCDCSSAPQLQEHAEIIASDRSCRWNQTPADQVTRSLCSLCIPMQHGLRRFKAQIWSIQKPPPADPHSGSGQTHTACTSACLGPQDFYEDWGLIRIHRIVMTVLKAGESLKSSSLLAAVPYLRHHLRQGSH